MNEISGVITFLMTILIAGFLMFFTFNILTTGMEDAFDKAIDDFEMINSELSAESGKLSPEEPIETSTEQVVGGQMSWILDNTILVAVIVTFAVFLIIIIYYMVTDRTNNNFSPAELDQTPESDIPLDIEESVDQLLASYDTEEDSMEHGQTSSVVLVKENRVEGRRIHITVEGEQDTDNEETYVPTTSKRKIHFDE